MKIPAVLKNLFNTSKKMVFFSTSQYQGKTYRILSLDGGGTRGILEGKILEHMEKQTQKKIYELFDGIAGTSTGGILALSSSVPKSTKNLINRFSAKENLSLYTDPKICQKIFSSEVKQKGSTESGKNIISLTWNGSGSGPEVNTDIDPLKPLIQTQYSSNSLEDILQERFGNMRLSHMLNDVLITSLDINTRLPHIFTRSAARQAKDLDLLIWEIARITSAAPTFFNPFLLNKEVLVDGGMCANNPTMCAIVDALSKGIPLSKIFCVSLGTGQINPTLNTTNWGKLQLVPYLFDILCESNSQLVDQQALALLGKKHYHRFQPILTRPIQLDGTDSKTLKELEDIGDAFIADKKNRGHLEQVYDKLDRIGEKNKQKDIR